MGVKRQFWTDLWWLLVYTFIGALLVALCTIGTAVDGMLHLPWQVQLHVIQWLQNILMFALPALLWVKLYKKEIVCESLKLYNCSWLKMGQVALLMLVGLPLMDWITSVTQLIPWPDFILRYAENSSAEQAFVIGELLSIDGFWGWTELIMLMCVATAIGEEIMFRGALRRCFEGSRSVEGRRVWIAVIVGLLFSLGHLEVYGFVTRWLLGAGLMLLVYWSGSIWPSVLAHAMNNLAALISMKWALANNISMYEAPTIYEMIGAWSVVASVLLSAVVIYWMWHDYSATTSNVSKVD